MTFLTLVAYQAPPLGSEQFPVAILTLVGREGTTSSTARIRAGAPAVNGDGEVRNPHGQPSSAYT